MNGALRHLRRVVVAKDDVKVEPFIMSDPPSRHTVVEVLHAKPGQSTDDFHENVNRFMEEHAEPRGLIPIRLWTPQ